MQPLLLSVFRLPCVLGTGLGLGHAEEAHIHARALIAPGRVNVVGYAV